MDRQQCLNNNTSLLLPEADPHAKCQRKTTCFKSCGKNADVIFRNNGEYFKRLRKRSPDRSILPQTRRNFSTVNYGVILRIIDSTGKKTNYLMQKLLTFKSLHNFYVIIRTVFPAYFLSKSFRKSKLPLRTPQSSRLPSTKREMKATMGLGFEYSEGILSGLMLVNER